VRLAQRVERDESTWHDHVSPDPRVEAGDPVIDAEAYAPALGEIRPCGYGAVVRHLGWSRDAGRAGRRRPAPGRESGL